MSHGMLGPIPVRVSRHLWMPAVIGGLLATGLAMASPPDPVGAGPADSETTSQVQTREAQDLLFDMKAVDQESLVPLLSLCEVAPVVECEQVRLTLVGPLDPAGDRTASCRRFISRTLRAPSPAPSDDQPIHCRGTQAHRYGVLVPEGVDATAVRSALEPWSTEIHLSTDPLAYHGAFRDDTDLRDVLRTLAALGVVPEPPTTSAGPPIAEAEPDAVRAERVAQRLVDTWQRRLSPRPYRRPTPPLHDVGPSRCGPQGNLTVCKPSDTARSELDDELRDNAEDLLKAVEGVLGADETAFRLHVLPDDALDALSLTRPVSFLPGQVFLADSVEARTAGRLLAWAFAQAWMLENTELPRWLQDGIARYIAGHGVSGAFLALVQRGAGELAAEYHEADIGTLLVAQAVRTRGPGWLHEVIACGRRPSCNAAALVPFDPEAVLFEIDLFGRDAFYELDMSTCTGTTWSDPWEIQVPIDGHRLLRCKKEEGGAYLPSDPHARMRELRERGPSPAADGGGQ